MMFLPTEKKKRNHTLFGAMKSIYIKVGHTLEECFMSYTLKDMLFYLFKVEAHFFKSQNIYLLQDQNYNYRIFPSRHSSQKLNYMNDVISFSPHICISLKLSCHFSLPLCRNICKISLSPFFFSTALIFTLEPYFSFLINFSPLHSQRDQ